MSTFESDYFKLGLNYSKSRFSRVFHSAFQHTLQVSTSNFSVPINMLLIYIKIMLLF